jgi:hypothetical protein
MAEQERPTSIRLWLARYKPDRVRCTLASGDLRELPKPTTTRGQWVQLEHAIVTLKPSYIEAFVGNECVAARALEGADDTDPAAPAVPVKEADNPFASMVAALPVVTQLIVDAGDASAARHQEAYKMAFEAMLEQNKQYLQLVQVISSRLGGLEKAWHQMLLDREGAAGDGNDAMVQSILGDIVRGGGGPAKPNGASASAKPEGEHQ